MVVAKGDSKKKGVHLQEFEDDEAAMEGSQEDLEDLEAAMEGSQEDLQELEAMTMEKYMDFQKIEEDFTQLQMMTQTVKPVSHADPMLERSQISKPKRKLYLNTFLRVKKLLN